MNKTLMAFCGIGLLNLTIGPADISAETAESYDARFADFPTYSNNDSQLEMSLGPNRTDFRVWSPEAQDAIVLIYDTDRNSSPTDTLRMQRSEKGTWTATADRSLLGKFYTFRIKHSGKWLSETPGVWAKALGTNGQRAAIIDLKSTDPEGWDNDRGPALKSINDAIIYEMHHRDMSMHPSSGIVHKGKFLAMTENGTRTPGGAATGIDHLKELGITHVHILPSFDYNSVDEENLQKNQYNWGYDPLNYNAPEGSYSTDPANPEARIREMKQMIKSFHDAGIGVVMDVVYNHTATNDDSNFSLTAPGYYYRHRPDGSYSDASACGNETASERAQMRDFIVNSVKYWAKEYHIDGFRFDLMAIHDTETMNLVAEELKKINPDIIIYGEGWTAADSPLPVEKRALKENVSKMNGVAVFSDDLRDAVKGHFSTATDRGFATGKSGLEETVKIGIVASTAHPQVDYSKGNNSTFPYATSPQQIINYVSCHDDLCLTDKLDVSMPGTTETERQRAAKLAQTIVFTSQGTPFIFAGEEIFRNKQGVHNSYKSPDSINAIDWTLKEANAGLFDYYRELIALRKNHPAFRMSTAEEIAKNIVFDKTDKPDIVSYSIKNHAGGDEWQEIKLVFNGGDSAYTTNIPRGKWTMIADDGHLKASGLRSFGGGKIEVAPRSALILAR